MSNAFLAGLLAGSAFVVGGAIAHRLAISAAALGLLTGFGAGALFAAVAYELVATAGEVAGRPISVAAGLIVGSGLHLVATGSTARHLRSIEGEHSPMSVGRHLVADVVPEAVVVVGSLVSHHHVSAAVIVAVFVCGVPEAIFATTRLAELGVRARTVMTSWIALALLSGATAAVAFNALDGAREGTIAFVLAAAGGAVLTNITTELIPEGYLLVGRTLGIVLVAGFAVVFALAEFA